MMACFCESTRDMSVLALSTFHVAATEFGLSVNFKKTKFLVAEYGIVPGDCDNIVARGLVVRLVSFIVYLGSVLTPDTRSSADIRRQLAQAHRHLNISMRFRLMISLPLLLEDSCIMLVFFRIVVQI